MKNKYIIPALVLVFFAFTSCSTAEDELDPNQILLGLGGDQWPKTEIDNWLYTNYVKNYNIEVKYKWDQSELDLNKVLVPIEEARVIPLMKVIKRAWIDPYEASKDKIFVQQLCPKKFVLVGSAKYNGATITLGEAEGGRKIVMYRLNWFTAQDAAIVREIMKTVHHEFAHTMHQTVMYDYNFGYLTPGGYTSAWTNVTAADAQKKGFISPYACAAPDEDFVETISRIAVFGKDWFDQYVAQAAAIYANPSLNVGMEYDPGIKLRQKEAYVVNYLKNTWGIEFYDTPYGEKGLVTRVQEALDSILRGDEI